MLPLSTFDIPTHYALFPELKVARTVAKLNHPIEIKVNILGVKFTEATQ